jgi:hypothetical protein
MGRLFEPLMDVLPSVVSRAGVVPVVWAPSAIRPDCRSPGPLNTAADAKTTYQPGRDRSQAARQSARIDNINAA